MTRFRMTFSLRTAALLFLSLLAALGLAWDIRIEPSALAATLPNHTIQRGNQTIPPAPRPGMPTPTPVFPPDDYF